MKANAIYRVEFRDVGREKKSWSEDLPTLDVSRLVRSVRVSGALASRDIDVWESEPADEADKRAIGCGIVTAGMHTVGRWRIVTRDQ